jgi:predicted kinase
MRVVYIMRGIPGSGKSTLIRYLNFMGTGAVVSADDYFVNDRGEYRFDPTLLGKAHEECKRKFKEACEEEVTNIFVDNTNIKKKDFKPYIQIARNHGYSVVELKLWEEDVEKCFNRNTHGVPKETIARMRNTLFEGNE